MATHKLSGQPAAVKVILKKKLKPMDVKALKREAAILQALDHKFILKCLGFYDEPEHYYLVMECLKGGELFDRLVSKQYYNEREARDIVKVLLQALQYLHQNNVAHRDVKPENIILTNKDDESDMKFVDFGFATYVEGAIYETEYETTLTTGDAHIYYYVLFTLSLYIYIYCLCYH